jgi:hypothetical protein
MSDALLKAVQTDRHTVDRAGRALIAAARQVPEGDAACKLFNDSMTSLRHTLVLVEKALGGTEAA